MRNRKVGINFSKISVMCGKEKSGKLEMDRIMKAQKLEKNA